jgi:PAS domain S-box-containing protein
VLLVGAASAAAALALLLAPLPASQTAERAAALSAAVSRFGWAAARGPAGVEVERQRDAVDAALRALFDADEAGTVRSSRLSERWSALHTMPSGHWPAAEIDALAAEAEAVAATQRLELLQQTRRREWTLLALTLLLVGVLTVPVAGLWRQRRRLRAAIDDFAGRLGDGQWQDAVQGLRDDRGGTPSAFDTLASGVEGVMAETERRWQALADLSADWYWETDAAHRLSRLSGASPPVVRIGGRPEDVIGRRRDQMPYLDPPEGGWEAYHARLDRHEAFRDVEMAVRGRGGEVALWVSISGRPRRDANGRFVGYEGVGRDITERRLAAQRLQGSEQRWSLMAGLASDWYWQTDAEHRVLPLAPEYAKRGPLVAERVVGRTRWEAYPDALPAGQWAEHRADLEARRPFRGLQLEVEVEPGRWLWFSISGLPRHDAQGRFVGYHGVGRDITARKQAERLLLRHNEELQRAVEERTRDLARLNLDLEAFSRQLAHELRTPIGHVQGLAQLLEARAGHRLGAEERRLLELQVGAARHMRETVEALLQLARSTVQAMPLEDIDVSALAHEVIGELPPVERAGPLAWAVEPGIRARASPGALRIVLANLLGNAAKFTRKEASPHVRVSSRRDPDGRIRVFVEDNGAGFAGTDASRLFAPFSRLHAADDYAGTGIGLTIVQRIVERLGGSVRASGAPGGGARFEFTLEAPKSD